MELGERDVRDMVRLVGEVAALPGGHAEKKRFLMDGLCRLIGGDKWVWGLSCQPDPQKPQSYVSNLWGGFTEDGVVKLLEAIDHPATKVHNARFLTEVQEKGMHLTRLREQITDEDLYLRSEARPVWERADVGSLILSLRPLEGGCGSMIAIYRRCGRPKFTQRESRIAHIILTEVPWLHEQGWPEDRGVSVPTLSPRERLTLNLLTLGQSRKQIAEAMKISPHTVQEYTKELYRHFGVNSQAELMTRFYQGNGRDVE